MTLQLPIPTRRVERGPTARRGLQFSEEADEQLLQAVTRAMITLRMIRSVQRPSMATCAELRELRALGREELVKRRRETNALLTDLRAELRRRGHF